MTANGHLKKRPRSGTIEKALHDIDADPDHHITGGFRTQTPLIDSAPDSPIHVRRSSEHILDRWSTESEGLWKDFKSLRWVVVPRSSFKMLLIPIVLWANWELLAPYVAKGFPNPFAALIFISHPTPSPPGDPRYKKGYLDLVFVAYYIVFWSFFRQMVNLSLCRPLAKWFGIKKVSKQDRFGEQGYAVIYFAIMGSWGLHIMSQQRTWWYRTEYFWIDYPHWEMKPELKAYYLVQAAYWCQQLMVLLLKLEKPRKDHLEFMAHHFVTLWLVGWSYLVNMTLIGNAVYLSMDIPDAFLAFSKLLNYIHWDRAKIFSFLAFMAIWTYFRHWLNIVILHSVWTQFDLIPESTRKWSPEDGVWLAGWMKYQISLPIFILQLICIFWYFLILRIGARAITSFTADDTRSDDEDDDEDEVEDSKDD